MNILKLLKIKIKVFLKPNGLTNFLHELPKKSRLLDIGCGNESPKRIKFISPSLLPNIHPHSSAEWLKGVPKQFASDDLLKEFANSSEKLALPS